MAELMTVDEHQFFKYLENKEYFTRKTRDIYLSFPKLKIKKN